MKYNADYFIEKLSAIPSEKWIPHVFEYKDKHCVNGHLGLRDTSHVTPESAAFARLFNRLEMLGSKYIGEAPSPILPDTNGYSNRAAIINNGYCAQYRQDNCKDRVLAALYDIKAMEAVDEANGIISQNINIENNESELHAYQYAFRPFRFDGDYQTIYNRGIQQLYQRPEERVGRPDSIACTV